MILTFENYHSPENTCITNSKVGDFLKSKAYYREKHVARTLVEEPSTSMLVGSIADAVFSGIDPDSLFVTGSRRKPSKVTEARDDGSATIELDPRTVVTPAVYQKGVDIGRFLVAQDFYRWYNDPAHPGRRTVFQKPLSGRIVREAGGERLAVPIAAMPDALTFDQEDEVPTVYVDDLKTARNWDMATPEHWHRKCAAFGYYRQLAVMGQLAAEKYKAARRFVFRHVVVGTTKEGTWKVRLFVVPQEFLEPAWSQFSTAAFAIATETEWKDPAIGWDKAVELPAEFARLAAAPVPDEDGFQEVA